MIQCHDAPVMVSIKQNYVIKQVIIYSHFHWSRFIQRSYSYVYIVHFIIISKIQIQCLDYVAASDSLHGLDNEFIGSRQRWSYPVVHQMCLNGFAADMRSVYGWKIKSKFNIFKRAGDTFLSYMRRLCLRCIFDCELHIYWCMRLMSWLKHGSLKLSK